MITAFMNFWFLPSSGCLRLPNQPLRPGSLEQQRGQVQSGRLHAQKAFQLGTGSESLFKQYFEFQ